MDFNSPKFFPPNFLHSLFAELFAAKGFLLGSRSFYEVGGGGVVTDTLVTHACLTKTTVATRYKQKTTAIVYVALIHNNVFIKYAYNLSIDLNGDQDEQAHV